MKRLDHDVPGILEKYVSDAWRCNKGHIKGRDVDVIIDTGMGLRPIALEINILSERPVIAVCTRGHNNHAGGLCQFKRRLGHTTEARIFADPTHNLIIAELLDASVIKKQPYEGFDLERWCYEPAPLIEKIDEGDVIELRDRYLRVIHLPAHSRVSIALWEEATETFFSGTHFIVAH